MAGYDLPTTVPDGLDDDQLMALMARDKKVRNDGLVFALTGRDGVEVVTGVDPQVVRETLAAVR